MQLLFVVNKLIMLKNKKSQGLSINAIIIAVIALVVLVVLVAIFTGRIGVFSSGISKTGTCQNSGGQCQASACGNNQEQVFVALDCNKDYNGDGIIDNSGNPYCCKAASPQQRPVSTPEK